MLYLPVKEPLTHTAQEAVSAPLPQQDGTLSATNMHDLKHLCVTPTDTATAIWLTAAPARLCDVPTDCRPVHQKLDFMESDVHRLHLS